LWGSYETRSSFRSLLTSEKNVERVFALQEDKAEELMRCYGPVGFNLEGGAEMSTNCWEIPVIFKVDVKKGFSYKDSSGKTDVIESPLKAMVLYDGIWFMAAYEPNQYSDMGEVIWLEPRIREILVNMMHRWDKFVPQIVPPCVASVDVSLQIISRVEEGQDIRFPRYDSAEKRGEKGSKLLIRYKNNKDKVLDDDIAMIMLGIYSNIKDNMQSYYLLAGLSDWHEKRRYEMIEKYHETCGAVEEYLKISNWNLLKKSIISNKLSKRIMRMQMELVNNSIWDNRVMRRSVEIDSYQDKLGIMDHIREELRRNITEAYEQSREEYEGFMSAISSIEKMTSQHNIVLLSITAVIAGLIGAIIGSVIG
jgi:hypothetical protein